MKGEAWTLPAIFGIVGIILFIGAFNGLGLGYGLFGVVLIVLAIVLHSNS